jgi:hypothetical protein
MFYCPCQKICNIVSSTLISIFSQNPTKCNHNLQYADKCLWRQSLILAYLNGIEDFWMVKKAYMIIQNPEEEEEKR